MGFYLDICNNSLKFEYYDSLSENEDDRCIHIERKSKRPSYFRIDEIFNDFINN